MSEDRGPEVTWNETDTVPEPVVVGKDGRTIKVEQTWLKDEWKPILKVMERLNGRLVQMQMVCAECETRLLPVDRDEEGSTLVECACTRRRWRV